jgi:superfamily II RNA helicase
MTGRAGRRGQDKIGFMLLVPGRFMDVRHIKRLLFRKSEEISGQLRSDFSMVLNLLLSQTPENIKGIFDMSFTVFQQHSSKVEIPFHAPRPLWEDFCRHMDFLIEEGFVDKNGRPTDTGAWASKLRLDQPLLIAECLKREAFPKSDAKLFAAVVAPFVYDGVQSIKIIHKKTPGELRHAVDRVFQSVKPLMERMKTAGFEVHPVYRWPAAVMYDWAEGADWDELVHEFGIADGDLAALVLRTADNLRQIMSLKETHPVMAELAMQAKEAIFREPVVFE